jgi:ribonuclease HII
LKATLTLGLDEAGRGPVLGPMVLCGVLCTPTQAARLTRAGVADSKRFSGPDAHEARLALVPVIQAAVTAFHLRVVPVCDIDRYTAQGLLNALEREHAVVIIGRIGHAATRILCDGERMFAPLRDHYPHLESKNRAEDAHAAVAAASILAKVRRDELFACIARRYAPQYGRIAGGGYFNAATHRFLDDYRARTGGLPPEARRTWMRKQATQLSLLGEASP